MLTVLWVWDIICHFLVCLFGICFITFFLQFWTLFVFFFSYRHGMSLGNEHLIDKFDWKHCLHFAIHHKISTSYHKTYAYINKFDTKDALYDAKIKITSLFFTYWLWFSTLPEPSWCKVCTPQWLATNWQQYAGGS